MRLLLQSLWVFLLFLLPPLVRLIPLLLVLHRPILLWVSSLLLLGPLLPLVTLLLKLGLWISLSLNSRKERKYYYSWQHSPSILTMGEMSMGTGAGSMASTPAPL